MTKSTNIFRRAYDAIIRSNVRRAEIEVAVYRELLERSDRD
jgi:hypothetical protein